jgi:ABC-type lipoprotein release transport system permease subunit
VHAARLAVKRSRARSTLLLALFCVVAVTAFLLTGIVGYLAGTADTAVRQTLSAGPATAQAVQVEARLATDSDQQTDAITQLLHNAFTDADATVHRTVRSNPAPASVGVETAELVLMADPNLPDYVTVTAGEWPGSSTGSGVIPAALQASAADALNLAVGDQFTIEGTEFVIAATWLPVDATDPRWFGDPAVASGMDLLSAGPVVVAESVLADLSVRSYARWTVVPTLAAGNLPALSDSLDRLAVSVERAESEQNVALAGTLADSIDAVQRGMGVARALVTVPAVLVAVVGLITLAQLARLLVAVRRTETELLRARGASVARLTAGSLVESAVVILPGTALGAIAAIGLLGSGLIPLAVGAMWASAWPAALAVAVGAILVSVVVGWRAAAAPVGPARGDAGRASRSVTIGAAALVLVAAGVSVWQFKLYGSPLLVGADGDTQVDPLAVIAPALLLVALAMLGLLAFSPIARLLERWSARGRGILPALPVRQVSRRLPVFGVAMLLVTLSVSGATLTAVYSQTWAVASRTAAQLANGADVRIQLSPPATVESPAALVTALPYLRLPGAAEAAVVLGTPARVADDSVGLTAMAAERMPEVMHPVEGAVDPAQLASALTSERSGVPLDGDDLRLTVTAGSGVAQPGQVDVFAWLEDIDGALALVPMGRVPLAEPGEATLTASVPESRGEGWVVLAVQATLSAAEGASAVEVDVDGAGERRTLTLSSTDPTTRAITYPGPSKLPVVVTEQLVSRLSLEPGSTFNARIPSTASTIEAVVVGGTPAIPATTGRLGMIADLPTLNRYLLATSERMPQANEVWLSTDPGADLRTAAVGVSSTAATVTSVGAGSGDRLIAPALVVLWWGAAGALLLAAIAVFAITSTFAQDRRGEVIVLRALGMSSTEQARNRLLEMVSVLGAAMVTGVVTGLIASALTVSELATTAAGGPVPVSLRFDALGWLTLVFALAATLVTISTSYVGRVARQARDTEYREEAR